MSKLGAQIKKNGSPPPLSPLPSFPSHSASASSPSGSKISPVVLLVIIILTIIFFVSGILHLLVRFLMKRPSFYSSVSHSNRQPENPGSDALQRQLQQLFRLHDSGLDQALIDALPVFYYTDIMGLKEPFDCAVCLCEFSDQDKLRLLPMCSHAFHISCIDTWLLSNSTCPLCRGSLLTSGLENQEFSLDYWRELSFGCSIDGDNNILTNNGNGNGNGHSFHLHNNNYKPTIMEENASERRVFSVRLGKFRSSNNGGGTTRETSTSSSIQLDARRCYSLGSYQYVLADSNLQVALLSAETGHSSGGIKVEKMVDGDVAMDVDVDVEGKKIRRNKGDSFSVSKIWLWSKKNRFPASSETNLNAAVTPPLNVILPLSSRDQIIH